MANPKGNPQNLTPQAHKLTREDRSKGGKASAKNRKVKDIVIELLLQNDYADMYEASRNLIKRSVDSSKDLEMLLAILGQKPKEQIEISQEEPFEVNITVV